MPASCGSSRVEDRLQQFDCGWRTVRLVIVYYREMGFFRRFSVFFTRILTYSCFQEKSVTTKDKKKQTEHNLKNDHIHALQFKFSLFRHSSVDQRFSDLKIC